MNKLEFLLELAEKLSPMPMEEIEDRWNYYSEMIDDRMEEGLTEEEAVAELGSVEEVAAQIVSDIPQSMLAKERKKQKRHRSAWEIAVWGLGSPIWASLLIAAVAVTISLYVVLWSVIVSLWAVFVSLAAGALAGVAVGMFFAVSVSVPTGVALIGTGIICAGLCIFAFFGCRAATKGAVALTKKIALYIKRKFAKREEA